MSAGENYANQDNGIFAPSPCEMTQELYREWHAARLRGRVGEGTVSALIRKAHAGSWMAGNMLHLSEVEWDRVVGDEPFEYSLATYHGDTYAPGTGGIYDRGREIDES